MDFADSCLVLLAEKLRIPSIATIDRDFSIYLSTEKRDLTQSFHKHLRGGAEIKSQIFRINDWI